MSDIVQRLRTVDWDSPDSDTLIEEAADEIERLRHLYTSLRVDAALLETQNAELLAALEDALAILEIYYVPNSDGSTPPLDLARAAIEKAK